MDDSSAWTGCNNPPVVPTSCPNDNTFRPHPDTGGLQNFGISLYNYLEGDYVLYECYIYWVDDPYAGDGATGYWVTECYPYAVVHQSAYTYGYARWDSRWGTQQTYVGQSGLLKPISTLAFKALELPHCRIDQFLGTAKCNTADPNVTYVPNPGMEDALEIPNPNCRVTSLIIPIIGPNGRTGDASDRDRGCFVWRYAATNLPTPYVDTTFGDTAAIYDLAIGSAVAELIQEGTTYSNYAEFWAWGNNNVVGQPAWHSVSVDSYVADSLACSYGKSKSPPEPEAFCLFPVDSSRVSEKIPFS
jgi:hypothetical protein